MSSLDWLEELKQACLDADNAEIGPPRHIAKIHREEKLVEYAHRLIAIVEAALEYLKIRPKIDSERNNEPTAMWINEIEARASKLEEALR